MSRKVSFKKNKKNENLYNVSLENLTLGEVMAMKNALDYYGEHSAVAADVRDYMRNGIIESNDQRLQDALLR